LEYGIRVAAFFRVQYYFFIRSSAHHDTSEKTEEEKDFNDSYGYHTFVKYSSTKEGVREAFRVFSKAHYWLQMSKDCKHSSISWQQFLPSCLSNERGEI
jgi:hypothetical protein